MTRKYLPFTIAKSFKHSYVKHMAGDFETCFVDEERKNVRVWAWGLLDILTGEYNDGNDIATFMDAILNDKSVYDIAYHNLKFDGSFIIPGLYKRNYKYIPNNEFMDMWQSGKDVAGYFTHNITSMGQWFSIIIGKHTNVNKSTPAFVHIWDSAKLFPNTKLRELGVQYNTSVQKIKETTEFYERIRPIGHELDQEERDYLKADCIVLAHALKIQLDTFQTIYRTQASKAFTFFKDSCKDEAGNANYKKKYEGMQQWTVPDVPGLEDYAGAIVRYLPRQARDKINASGAKLVDAFEYYIPDYYTWADIKLAYNGGISYVNPHYIERSIYQPITVIDVNSMYPYCLRTFPIPFGRFTKIAGAPDFSKRGAWIAGARVSFKLKSEHHLPCIQIKEKYGRKWLRESTDYMKYGEEDKYNEDFLFFTSVDFETFKENYDFTVHKWLYHYYFPNVSNMDGKRFVDKFYAQKQDAEKRMKAIKKAKPDSYETDPEYIRAKLDRLEAKIMLNSAYGKHGTKYFLYSKDSVFEGPDLPIKYVPEDKLQRDPNKDPSHYYCPYAAFVTAYARQMLVRTWNGFKGRAVYCDTDSIHFIGTPDDIPEELLPTIDTKKTGGLGLWKVEGEFVKGRYIRSKTYIEVDKDGAANITCAGATPEIKALMNWDTFRVGFNAWNVVDALNQPELTPEMERLRSEVFEYYKREELDYTEIIYKHHSKLTPKQYPDGVALESVNFEIKSQKL